MAGGCLEYTHTRDFLQVHLPYRYNTIVMLTLLKEINSKADNAYGQLKEQNRQRYFVFIIILIFFVFLGLGFAGGALVSSGTDFGDAKNVAQTPEEIFYDGQITYVDPQLYSEEDVSYVLQDKSGKVTFLLKSRDQKLVVAEGQWASVYGTVSDSADGKEKVLTVSNIVLRQKR